MASLCHSEWMISQVLLRSDGNIKGEIWFSMCKLSTILLLIFDSESISSVNITHAIFVQEIFLKSIVPFTFCGDPQCKRFDIWLILRLAQRWLLWASSTGLTEVCKFKPRLPAQWAVGTHRKGPSRMKKVTSRMNWPIRNSDQIRN